MTSREYKYLRAQTIRRHQNAMVVMSIGASGIEMKGGIKCGECGLSYPKKEMLRCVNGDDVEYLCYSCNDGTWYCMGCGQFCAGISSFEMNGYCDNCWDEIKSAESDEEEYDQWEQEGWE